MLAVKREKQKVVLTMKYEREPSMTGENEIVTFMIENGQSWNSNFYFHINQPTAEHVFILVT